MEDKTPLTAENITEEAERTYQLYALAGIQNKKDFTNGFEIGYEKATASLQERVTQLESDKERLHKVIVGHEETNIALSEQIMKLEQLNEKLMGLLEEQFKGSADAYLTAKGFNACAGLIQNAWQSFCKEKGISPSPPEAAGQ